MPIVDFAQDPAEPYGTGNFRDDKGRVMYLHDPETAQAFAKTMPGSQLGKRVADESTEIARQQFGGQAPSRGPDLRLASGAPAQGSTLAGNPLAMPTAAPSAMADVQIVGPAVAPGGKHPGAPAQGSTLAGNPLAMPTAASVLDGVSQLGSALVAPGKAPIDAIQQYVALSPGKGGTATPGAPPAGAPQAAADPAGAVRQYVAMGGGKGALETTGRQQTEGAQRTGGTTVTEGRDKKLADAEIALQRTTQGRTNEALRAKAQADDARNVAGVQGEMQGLQTVGALDVQKGFGAKREQFEIKKAIDQLNTDFANNEKTLDPDRFKRNMSTGQKIGMIILASLNGAFGAIIGKKNNDVLDMLNLEIERDIDAQKQQIAGNRVLIGNKISEFMRQGRSAEDAEKLATDALKSGVINMAKLEKERSTLDGQQAQAVDLLIAQLEEQREMKRGEQRKETEDRASRASQTVTSGQTVTTAQSKTGGLSEKEYYETIKSRLDAEKAQIALDNDKTRHQNVGQMATVIEHHLTPEEADKIQERVQAVGPGLAETTGLVAALKNVVEATGSKVDETTGSMVDEKGQTRWNSDLAGVGYIDEGGGYASYIPGYDKAKKLGLVRPDVDKLKAAQSALIQYLATNVTGAAFSPAQLETFRQQAGALDLGSEQGFKENVENLLKIVFAQRNAQLGRLGPDGQKWFAYSQEQARAGAQPPPLVKRGDQPRAGAAPPGAPPLTPRGEAPAQQGAPSAPTMPQGAPQQAPAPDGPAPPPAGPTPAPGLTPEFENATLTQADGMDLNGEHVLRIMHFETGGTFSPATVAKSSASHAGLLQFGKQEWAEAARLGGNPGITWEQAKQMQPEEQLPYALAYLKGKGLSMESTLDQYYTALAAPAFIFAADDTVIYAAGSDELAKNPSWDANRDGHVTRGDFTRLAQRLGRPTARPQTIASR